MDPLPKDAETNFASGRVLHQIEHVVVAEEVRRFERRGLETLSKCIAILQADTEQIAAPRIVAGLLSSIRPSASACV